MNYKIDVSSLPFGYICSYSRRYVYGKVKRMLELHIFLRSSMSSKSIVIRFAKKSRLAKLLWLFPVVKVVSRNLTLEFQNKLKLLCIHPCRLLITHHHSSLRSSSFLFPLTIWTECDMNTTVKLSSANQQNKANAELNLQHRLRTSVSQFFLSRLSYVRSVEEHETTDNEENANKRSGYGERSFFFWSYLCCQCNTCCVCLQCRWRMLVCREPSQWVFSCTQFSLFSNARNIHQLLAGLVVACKFIGWALCS